MAQNLQELEFKEEEQMKFPVAPDGSLYKRRIPLSEALGMMAKGELPKDF